MEEQHKFDSDDTDIAGSNVPNTAVEVGGNMAQLDKPVLRRDEMTWISLIRPMPQELVQPVPRR